MAISKKQKAYRHGEIAFVSIKKLPVSYGEKVKSKKFLVGSHGNPHTYDNGELFLTKEGDVDNIFGYFIAKNTTLFHKQHGSRKNASDLKTAKLPNGIYELRRQVEIVNEEMKPIID